MKTKEKDFLEVVAAWCAECGLSIEVDEKRIWERPRLCLIPICMKCFNKRKK